MKKNKMDALINETLKAETSSIKMSPLLKEKILGMARDEKPGLYKRFLKLMNTTIEISLPPVIAACFIICIFAFSAFGVTVGMKRDKSIMGYTSVKTVNSEGTSIIMDNKNEVNKYEKNKD